LVKDFLFGFFSILLTRTVMNIEIQQNLKKKSNTVKRGGCRGGSLIHDIYHA
jgi:hypothetical protein